MTYKKSTPKKAVAKHKAEAPKKEAAPKAAPAKTPAELKTEWLEVKAHDPKKAEGLYAAYVAAKRNA